MAELDMIRGFDSMDPQAPCLLNALLIFYTVSKTV